MKKKRVRYAVVGLGYISQVAVLPAFRKAKKNAELVAILSGNPAKRKKLARKFGVPNAYGYEDYDACLRSGEIDAVYIALPNNLHREYTVRAANAGVHVLCEKPMAVTEVECEEMIEACKTNRVKLMIAYRLHFEDANRKAVEIVRSGKLGEPRVITSTFTQQVRDERNIRLKHEAGGGTLYDIGIYCINAARTIFRDEPTEVAALSVSGREPRFREVDEATGAVLKFPGDRLVTFVSSFGASDHSSYRVVGSKGDLEVSPAYDFAKQLHHSLTLNGKTRRRRFRKRDQFAPELVYFSRCILEDREPEPAGREGLADVRVVRALSQSAETGETVRLGPMPEPRYTAPTPEATRAAAPE